LGASAEWQLNRSFGFEADALYHRLGYSGLLSFFDSGSGNFQDSSINVTGNSWDFPIMAKYRFGRVVRPFVAGGAVLRYIGPAHERGEETIGSPTNAVTRTVKNSPHPAWPMFESISNSIRLEWSFDTGVVIR
jgi:hypothetical protein